MSMALPILNSAASPAGRADAAPPPAPEAAHELGQLRDAHGRTVRDLRLSITDRCNFRCIYCMDPDYRYMPKMDLLSLEEYLAVVRVAVGLGVDKIRVTGGEPTLYPQLDALLAALGRMPLCDLAMTTNGSLMNRAAARRWRDAGLRRVTFSLDTLRADRIEQVTRAKTSVDATIRAIEAAHAADLRPVKVNAVIIRGVNDDEVANFADFARAHDVDMRLIEFMPLDSGRRWSYAHVVPAREMMGRLAARHDLVPVGDERADSTSMNYTFSDGSPGRIGIIAPVTRPFCGACSRLRVTADGKVRPCLFSHEEWDMRPLLRSGASERSLRRFLVDALWTKQAGHGIGSDQFRQPVRAMSAIGG